MSTRRAGWAVAALLIPQVAGPALAAEPVPLDMNASQAEATPFASSTLSPLARARAEAWHLSEAEWRRYTALLQGIRGSVSPPTLSPIEVLGIHARDARERRHYAEAWARAMREDVERILAFQRAYDEAGRRLYPASPLIDASRLPAPEPEAKPLAPNDRVLFFTRPECPACDALLARLLRRLDVIDGVDIYLDGVMPGDAPAVRAWAGAHGITPAWVRTRRVTLNVDAGALERLTNGRGEPPYLMRRRGEALTVLPAAVL